MARHSLAKKAWRADVEQEERSRKPPPPVVSLAKEPHLPYEIYYGDGLMEDGDAGPWGIIEGKSRGRNGWRYYFFQAYSAGSFEPILKRGGRGNSQVPSHVYVGPLRKLKARELDALLASKAEELIKAGLLKSPQAAQAEKNARLAELAAAKQAVDDADARAFEKRAKKALGSAATPQTIKAVVAAMRWAQTQ